MTYAVELLHESSGIASYRVKEAEDPDTEDFWIGVTFFPAYLKGYCEDCANLSGRASRNCSHVRVVRNFVKQTKTSSQP